jgi:mono/diheme cytochrome c family protein
MKGLSGLVLVASISFIAGAGVTYVAKTPWTSDMANQASIKPQEGPMLPPEGSVPTDLISGSGASSGKMSESPRGDQGIAHKHGASGAGDHQHDGPGGKHDHAAKNVAPTKTKDSQPLPTDLMGSAGTGPGKTIQSPNAREKAPSQGTGGHDHGSKAAPNAKASQQKHSSASHSHAPGAAHDHGASKSGGHQRSQSAPHKHDAGGHAHGKEEREKMKSGSTAMHHHDHGPGAGDAHTHGATQAQIVNPIKPTEASIKRGHQLFNTYCIVCHGPEGRGGMPIESKLRGIPRFTGELLRSVDDSHMFSMITSGHGPMPGYAEALTPEERWHVSNYVRTLQKKLSSEKKVAQGSSR